MRQKLLYLLMMIPFLLFLLIITSHEDEEDVEYKSGNGNHPPTLFSAMKSDVVRIARNVREPQCWRSNPDDLGERY